MHVVVDQDKCCGAGQCALLVPEVFDQREEDGVVELLQVTPPAELYEAVRHAIQACPATAIVVHEPVV